MDIKVLKTEIRSSNIRFLSPDVALCTWTEYQETAWNGHCKKEKPSAPSQLYAKMENGSLLPAS